MLTLQFHPSDEFDLVSLMSPRKEKINFIMAMNPMSFNVLMSPTKGIIGIFFMFREFEKDSKNKTPHGPFLYICVSQAQKGRKKYSREPPSHVQLRCTFFVNSFILARKTGKLILGK